MLILLIHHAYHHKTTSFIYFIIITKLLIFNIWQVSDCMWGEPLTPCKWSWATLRANLSFCTYFDCVCIFLVCLHIPHYQIHIVRCFFLIIGPIIKEFRYTEIINWFDYDMFLFKFYFSNGVFLLVSLLLMFNTSSLPLLLSLQIRLSIMYQFLMSSFIISALSKGQALSFTAQPLSDFQSYWIITILMNVWLINWLIKYIWIYFNELYLVMRLFQDCFHCYFELNLTFFGFYWLRCLLNLSNAWSLSLLNYFVLFITVFLVKIITDYSILTISMLLFFCYMGGLN